MKASNLSIWACITITGMILVLVGLFLQKQSLAVHAYILYWSAFVVLLTVGINDLIRIYLDQDPPITFRVREMTPKWAKFPLIILFCVLCGIAAGLPGFMVAVIGVLVGHFLAV